MRFLTIDEMQGASENRIEQYQAYCEGGPELTTKQVAIVRNI